MTKEELSTLLKYTPGKTVQVMVTYGNNTTATLDIEAVELYSDVFIIKAKTDVCVKMDHNS